MKNLELSVPSGTWVSDGASAVVSSVEGRQCFQSVPVQLYQQEQLASFRRQTS
ncbi:MAG: hypothetical protein ACLRRJ_04545 [Clostridium sp.]